MVIKEIFKELQVSLPAFFAGLAGGAVLILKYQKISLRRALAMVCASGVGSGYLTALAVGGFGLDDGMVGAVGFAIGLVFMLLLDVVISILKYIQQNPQQAIQEILSLLPFNKFKLRDEPKKDVDPISDVDSDDNTKQPEP